MHADVARLCPPPRRRRLAGESALDSAEVIGSSLLEAAGCTSDQDGFVSPSRPEDNCSTFNLVALRCTAWTRVAAARQGLFHLRETGEDLADEAVAVVDRVVQEAAYTMPS